MLIREALLADWYTRHYGFLWGLSYRITGSAADADDVVQETFVRAAQHAPDHLEDPRGWLMRVAVNAARDVLRRRKRQPYIGPWLPTPIETGGDDDAAFEPAADERTVESRYGLRESASLAFLDALEALTPTQRAVLLLRDVFDYSAGEVASVLNVCAGNVRIVHHRARRAMEHYDRRRSIPGGAARTSTTRALTKFLTLLGDADVRGIERMLAADAKVVTDGGGEFTALLHPVFGADAVARFFVRLSASRARVRVAIRSINEVPAALLEFGSPQGRRPPRVVLSVELDRGGRIAVIRVVASTKKLSALSRSFPLVAVPGAFEHADVRAPRPDGALVLMRHHAGNLMHVRQIVDRPGRQQL
jgi:RNA polymerase sigma-70 factor (ECF subfamily)